MIERGKQPRQIVGLGIGGRRGRDQADAFGGGGDRGKPGDRLEPKALRVADIVGKRRPVGEEDGVEFVRLGPLGELLIEGDVEDTIRSGALVAPRRFVMAARIDEEVEGKLSSVAHVHGSCGCAGRGSVGSAAGCRRGFARKREAQVTLQPQAVRDALGFEQIG